MILLIPKCPEGKHISANDIHDEQRNLAPVFLVRVSLLFPVYAGVLNDSPFRFNKYSQITSQALRNSLKESERVKAEKRGLTALRYQRWEDGKGGEQVCFHIVISFDSPACLT